MAQNATSAPTQVVPKPSAGKATVTGRIINSKTNKPYANTTVRLAEVYMNGDQGAYALDTANSPGALTDSYGTFVMPNITARDYVVFVGDVMGKYVVVSQTGTDQAKIWKAPADQVTSVGDVAVDLDQ